MPCVICEKNDKETKYKCSKCYAKYCSVACSKAHRESCPGAPAQPAEPKAKPETPEISEDVRKANPQFAEMVQNGRVQELIHSEGVIKHLKLIAQILEEPRLSGEQSQEGRRLVALKKIRELRKGGREANVAIEELAEFVSSSWQDEERNPK